MQDLKQLIDLIKQVFAFRKRMILIACPGRTVELRADHISVITRTNGSTFNVMLCNGRSIEFKEGEYEPAARALERSGLHNVATTHAEI